MGELLFIYAALAVFRMPFQQNYWLWKAIGFAGLGTFQARWIVQWLHSEKHKESRIPIAFWLTTAVNWLTQTLQLLANNSDLARSISSPWASRCGPQ